ACPVLACVRSDMLSLRLLCIHVPIDFGRTPGSSIAGKQVHSDKEATRVFNPWHLRSPTWDGLGTNLLQLIVSITFSPWIASEELLPEEVAMNALTGYYWLLMLARDSMVAKGSHRNQVLFPKVTVQNMLSMLVHMILRVAYWGSELPFEPSLTMEEPASPSRCAETAAVDAEMRSEVASGACAETAAVDAEMHSEVASGACAETAAVEAEMHSEVASGACAETAAVEAEMHSEVASGAPIDKKKEPYITAKDFRQWQDR
ncbi:unnamed protein product, partial [Polarella glacialis]